MKSVLKVVLFIFILLVGVSGLAIYWTFYRPLPNYSAHLNLPGIQDSVTINWDSYGVPHITASNKHDLYYAVGYVHAQDRLWQMTLIQLAAQGRFAEFFGKKMLPVDKYERTLGFWRMAKKMEQNLTSNERDILQAYADGVNAYVQTHEDDLPIQFSLAGIRPIPWNITYTLAFARMLAWQLNVSWWSKATYGYLEGRMKPAELKQLFPGWPEGAPTSLDSSQTRLLGSVLMPMVKRDFEVRSILGDQGTHIGSNAWVVDGNHSTTGFPILAGDPHLGVQMPAKWYEVHLTLNGQNVSGATHPGAPVIILGQNDFLAWSLTNMMADDTDFFLEQTDPKDRERYVADSLADSVVYHRYTLDRQIIKIKGGNQVVMDVRYTTHGPVVSDIFPDTAITGNKVVAMDWTGYDQSDELGTLLKINWAQSFADFKKALPSFGVPGQNIMYADRAGNIAMFSIGHIPIRAYNPLLFRKGWDPSYNWKGFIPFNKMPHVINPAKGWIANANNRIVAKNYPYYITDFWEPPSRIEEIDKHLEQPGKFSVQDFEKMQNDTYSPHARQVLSEVMPVLESDAHDSLIAQALTYLRNWDYQYNTSETAATIFDTFYMKLARNTLEDEMGPWAYNNMIHLENLPVRIMDRMIKNDTSSFFNNINTPDTVETRNDMIIKSMREAVTFLRDSLGTEPFKWQWGKVHTVTFEPPLFGKAAQEPGAGKTLKIIVHNILSRGPYPAPGDGLTVNNGQYSWLDPYRMILGPSIRRIVDFSNMNSTLSVLPTGQSGNPLSPHYDDQIQLWLHGKYRVLSQNEDEVRSKPHQTMILAPAKSKQ